MVSEAKHGSSQSHMHPPHRWGKLRPGFSSGEWGRGEEAVAGLLMDNLRPSRCCALMGEQGQEWGQSLEHGLPAAFWGHLGTVRWAQLW